MKNFPSKTIYASKIKDTRMINWLKTKVNEKSFLYLAGKLKFRCYEYS